VPRAGRLRGGRDRRLRGGFPGRHRAGRDGLRADGHGDDLRHRADLRLPYQPGRDRRPRRRRPARGGGIAGAIVLYLILSGKIVDYDLAKSGLGQNGWGRTYLGGYGLVAAFLVEVIATFIFVFVILRVTGERGAGTLAGLVVGLTLVVLHFPFINVTGLSVNPARSLGPAVVVRGEALAQVWLFLIAPVIGGALAGIVDKATEAAHARRAKPGFV
jgi:hypothetical protein